MSLSSVVTVTIAKLNNDLLHPLYLKVDERQQLIESEFDFLFKWNVLELGVFEPNLA